MAAPEVLPTITAGISSRGPLPGMVITESLPELMKTTPMAPAAAAFSTAGRNRQPPNRIRATLPA